MDLLEKINRSFGTWYEGLFGGTDDVRPKDVLRRILAAMEDNRKEGFDNRVYVPNQYILEINVHDEEEKEYLLSFLDRSELEAAIRRYCQQNHYHIRGSLDFTVREVEDGDAGRRGEKVHVRCRYNSKVTGETRPSAARPARAAEDEEHTVAQVGGGEESGTVPSIAAAAFVIYAPDRPPYRYVIARGAVNIGRSKSSGNDVIIETDGQISKRHARVELDPDGRFTLYDLQSTNGTRVNGKRIDSRSLNDGDEITVGATRITFQQAPHEDEAHEPSRSGGDRAAGAYGGAAANRRDGSSTPPARVLRSRAARLVLCDAGGDVDDFLLASETTIGRGVTNDVVLPDRSVLTRHARIVHDGEGYLIETLTAEPGATRLNDRPVLQGAPERLKDGDHVGVGSLTLRFTEDL